VYGAHAIPGFIAGYDRDNRKSKWHDDFSQAIVIVGSVGHDVPRQPRNDRRLRASGH
jgi:hypothetical protein